MTTPPPRLPDEYLPIWQRVRALDEETRSRRRLARTLGVSTHTLQRLLVDGDVPRLATESNRRIRRSWIAIVVRLADHFGVAPREWLGGLGVTWDDRVGTLVDEVRASAAPSVTPSPEVELTVPRDGCLGLAYPGPGSFALRVGSRLVRAVAPDAGVAIVARPGAVVPAPPEPGPRARLGVDELATSGDGSDEADLLLPGLRRRLGTVTVDVDGAPSWVDLTAPALSGMTRVVPRWSPAHAHLVTQEEVPASSLRVTDAVSVDALAAELTGSTGPTVLLADAETAVLVFRTLRGGARPVRIDVVTDPDAPSFPIRIRMEAPAALRSRIDRALSETLFGTAASATGRLYADVLHVSWALAGPPSSGGSRHTALVLEHVPSAPEPFRSALARHLHGHLALAFYPKVLADGVPPALSRARDEAARRARAELPTLLPPGWRTGPDAGVPSAPPAHACGSCTSTLFPRVNTGVNPAYCTHCTSPDGTPMSATDRRAFLEKWLVDHNPGLDAALAHDRIRTLMERAGS